MNLFYRLFFIIGCPLLFSACEKIEADPGKDKVDPLDVKCLEIKETSRTFNLENAEESVYDGNRIIELRYFNKAVLQDYYTFNYGNDGRISEYYYTDVSTNTQSAPNKITYNAKGKWVKITRTGFIEDTLIYKAEYNSQDQIQKLTATYVSDDIVIPQFAITYTWVNGNNTRYTYTSADTELNIQYEFDLNQENKQREEQEKTSFFAESNLADNTIEHNKNMIKRLTINIKDLANGTSRQGVNAYSYEYNEAGFPTKLISNNSNGFAATVTTTTFEYDCE